MQGSTIFKIYAFLAVLITGICVQKVYSAGLDTMWSNDFTIFAFANLSYIFIYLFLSKKAKRQELEMQQ